jgi:hypothetical protein
MDWDQFRWILARMSEYKGDWQGIPVPVPDQPVTLHDRHPLAEFFREHDGVEYTIETGGPDLSDDYDEKPVNHWFSHKKNADVVVWKATAPGKPTRYFATVSPRAPDGSMNRLTFWLSTLGATDAWDLEAEHRAREKLRGLLSDRQWRMYDLAGAFLETSPRSDLTYMLRRLRPTLALSPRWPERPGHKDPENMRCLAVLCLHPVGYYQRTWAGCMVPTDDVIAHLLWLRADEAGFWGKANQHEPWTPEAGL